VKSRTSSYVVLAAAIVAFGAFAFAGIALNLPEVAAGDITLGPILLGSDKPVRIITPTATVRRLVNMTALTVVEASTPR
jgi:malate dehydrogenase (oxaloacetate-decarboxylating)(NADP+)